MQIPYLPVRGRKLPRVIGGNIVTTMEICRSSGLPIPMLLRLHQSNGYIKKKLRAWRVQKCNALVGAGTVLTRAAPQTNRLHGGCIGSRKEICETSGVPIPMVLRLHQSNGYMKRKLWACRVQKCISYVGADTVPSSAWPQTTPFLEGVV